MLWFAPVLVLLFGVTVYPTILVVWMSFQQTRYFEMIGFAGLANYRELFVSEAFWQLTSNSLIYVFGTLLIVLPLGLLSALMIQALPRGGKVVRVLLLVPWTLSQAVVGSFWLWLYNPSYGPVAYVARVLGFDAGLLLGDPDQALYLVILITAWWSFPYAMVMMSAALQGVPDELFEALSIDGGNKFHALRYVIWPYIAPALGSTGLTLSILYLTLITLIIVLTGGGPLGSTATWSLEVFRGTVQSVNIAPAAALSVVTLLANVVLGWGYLKLTGRVSA
ncbi:hypothetical protein AXW83_15635 [Bosea sp. PAMC 26642]|nr:hypothetical protein AXW83_15635 [Bosea sp. PAMC 26642]